MARLGNWGNIKFQTNDNRILTFDGLKRKLSVRTSKHNMLGGKPKLEFLGTDLETVTFSVTLNAMLGVRPRKTAEKFADQMRLGVVAPLVIGGKKIGKNKWMLTGISEAWNIVLSRGEVVEMKLDLSFTEYV